jgi:hypothetical protein
MRGIAKACMTGLAFESRRSVRKTNRHITREKKTKPALSRQDPSRFEEHGVARQAKTLPRRALQIASIAHSRNEEFWKIVAADAFGTTP